MEIFLLVLAFLLQVESGISINCFKCHSKDYRACDASREVKSCSGRNKQCYSLRYYSKINDEIEDHGFIKGCKDEKQVDCHSICQHYLDFGYEKCRVSCCEGDLCNINFQGLADQSKKSKRSSKDNNNDGITNLSADHFNNKQTLIIHLFSLLAIIFFHSWL